MPDSSIEDFRPLVIVPTFNEVENLPHVFEDLERHVGEVEVLFVADGSTDGTISVLRRSPWMSAIHLANLGYAASVRTGLEIALRAGYTHAVLMDADGQHSAAFVGALIEAARSSGAQVVIGSRFECGFPYRGSVLRHVGMKLMQGLMRLLIGVSNLDTTSGMKVLDRSTMRLCVAHRIGDFHSELLLDVARRRGKIMQVPIEVRERKAGQSMHGAASFWFYPARTLLAMVLVYMKRSPFRHDE